MLNHDAMAQLRQLKQTIHDSKDRGEGTVKGSQGRFGFVVLDDGREIYLPPEQMQRVFPDDRIAIEVVAGTGGKPLAQLERLLESPLRAFTGRYVVHNNAHFVEPDLPRMSRWLFVPPKLRRGGKQGPPPQHGDYVRARVMQHPFKDGKAQARIEAVIGGAQQRGVEARYALARLDLPDSAPALTESDITQPDTDARRDLTALPLVTIDGADTRDMDDALYAERVDTDGAAWKLTVAIADPGAWIKPGSTLEKAIAARAASAYLPGLSVPMLPERLADGQCSLQPDVERLALVCEMWVDAAGAITRYAFCEARIRSQAKLSYEQAAELLQAPSGDDAVANTDAVANDDAVTSDDAVANDDAVAIDKAASVAWTASLHTLHAAAKALQERRRQDHIVLPERNEYRAQLDDTGRITGYQRQSKNAAHQLVEECMIATNRCAADYLREDSGVFISHRGFRSDRRDNVDKLIAAELPQCTQCDVAALPDYVDLMHTVAATPSELPLREILARSLERAQFSTTATPHFGMGLTGYTTITSPIRKFNDYLTQRALKAKLRGATGATIDTETIAQLQDRNDRIRQAANFAQQWLDCEYLSKQERGRVWRAAVVHVTSSGCVVRLLDNGIQGFVDTRHRGEKFSFSPVYMRLRSAAHTFQLEQEIDVRVAAIDMKKHQVALELV